MTNCGGEEQESSEDIGQGCPPLTRGFSWSVICSPPCSYELEAQGEGYCSSPVQETVHAQPGKSLERSIPVGAEASLIFLCTGTLRKPNTITPQVMAMNACQGCTSFSKAGYRSFIILQAVGTAAVPRKDPPSSRRASRG